jgi:HAD superfamily hydrolase (TIGR01509 family)
MLAGPGRALLFDIDGTMADTDALHVEAFNEVFGPRGHVFDRARAARELMGFSTASLAERFLPDETPERQASIMDEKEALFRKLVSGKVQPVPGLMSLLAFADRAGIPMVAVTNAPRLNAELLISGLGIMDRFKAIVIGDELPHAKPHPLPYLEGLRAVDAVANLSVAFEDSRSGIASASAAGISTVGVRSSLSHADLVGAGALLTVASFDDPELMKLIVATMGW